MNIETATSFKRLLVAENQKADQLRRERDGAVALLRSLTTVDGTISCNYKCGKCLQCRMPAAKAFLSRLDAKGGK